MTTPIKTQKEYVTEGGKNCPFCDSSDVESQALQVDGPIAWSDCNCNTCGKEWDDLYRLVGFSEKQ
jgi:transposase-like protein